MEPVSAALVPIVMNVLRNSILLAIVVGGCDAPVPTKELASATAGAEPTTPSPPAPPTVTASQAPPPRAKETGTTPEGRLGTLPDGIGLAPGTKIPAATLESSEGKKVDLTAEGAMLVVFYRGGWCPFCNFQIRDLTRAHPELAKRGVTPVAISVDRVAESAKTDASYDIPFPVLSDPDLVAHEAFRVVQEVSDEELEKLKGYGVDLEAHSGRTHHKIAVPAIFLVDGEGTILWAHADRDYKTRPSIEQLLAVVDRLLPPKAVPR
jgi:peroxiredoxin